MGISNIYSPYYVDLKKLMLVEDDWNVFANKFINSPKKIKGLMLSTTAYYLESLSKQLGLNQVQSADLSRIIRDILLGDIFLGDFPTLISLKLIIDMDTANQIAKRIVSELFASTIEDINNAWNGISQSQSDKTQKGPQQTQYWEYKTVKYIDSDYFFTNVLNNAGREGWEAVGKTGSHDFLLKRKKSE